MAQWQDKEKYILLESKYVIKSKEKMSPKIDLTFKKDLSVINSSTLSKYINSADELAKTDMVTNIDKIKVTNKFLKYYQLLYLVKLSTFLTIPIPIEYSFTFNDITFTLQLVCCWNEERMGGKVEFITTYEGKPVRILFMLVFEGFNSNHSGTNIYYNLNEKNKGLETILKQVATEMGIVVKVT